MSIRGDGWAVSGVRTQLSAGNFGQWSASMIWTAGGHLDLLCRLQLGVDECRCTPDAGSDGRGSAELYIPHNVIVHLASPAGKVS